ALVTEPRGPEPEILEAARVAIDQRGDTELLGEAPQLPQRRRSLVEVDKVRLDPSLGEEPQRGASVGALPDSEDLHLHGRGNSTRPASCRSRTAGRPARRVRRGSPRARQAAARPRARGPPTSSGRRPAP